VEAELEEEEDGIATSMVEDFITAASREGLTIEELVQADDEL
jgi:hypothetical protein